MSGSELAVSKGRTAMESIGASPMRLEGGSSIGAMKRYPRRGRVSMKLGVSAVSPSVSLNRLMALFIP